MQDYFLRLACDVLLVFGIAVVGVTVLVLGVAFGERKR